MGWSTLSSNPWAVAIGGGVVVLFVGWLGRSLFRRAATDSTNGITLNQNIAPVMTQNFQSTAGVSALSKIHEKEFEVLPKAWQLLHEAHGAAFQLTKAFREWPNLDAMPEEQRDAFLASTRLAEFQRNEINGCKDKLTRYQEIISWYELDDAKRAQIELNNYLAVNSIFMTDALRQQFREVNRLLLDVIIHEQTARRYTGAEIEISVSARMERISEAKSQSARMNQISEMFNSIEAALQQRLRYQGV